MENDVYTVPTQVLFRNYSTNTGIQTRNLLLKNNTSRTLQTIVSYPFSPSFRLHAPPDQRSELKSTPPHIVIDLQPHSTSKVVIELKPPDDAFAEGHQHFHDKLVVLFGGVRALLVPLRAVHHGLEAANTATAAASQLQQQAAALAGVAFWPVKQKLDSCCNSFTENVRALYDIGGPAPQVIIPNIAAPPPSLPPSAPSVTAHGAAGAGTMGRAAVGKVADAMVMDVTSSTLLAGGGGERSVVDGTGDTESDPRGEECGSGGQQPTRQHLQPPQPPATAAMAAGLSLPPEGFSPPHTETPTVNGVTILEDQGAGSSAVQQHPYVLHKTVKLQGRVAVAVAAGGGGGGGGATAGMEGGSGGTFQSDFVNGGPAAACGSNPLGSRLGAQISPPRAESLRRTSSSGAGGGDTGSPAFSPVAASGSRLGSSSGAGRVAFALGGRLYDARGVPLDAVAMEVEGLTVVDCGESGTARSGSRFRGAPSTHPRASAPPSAPVTSPSPGTGGRPALAPLRHASSLPPSAPLRPVSAASAASMTGTPLGRPLPPPLPPSGGTAIGPGGGGGGGVDPLRQAALVAAMRELGISDLPAPSPRGAVGPGGADRIVPGASPSPAMPSYVQYGLPPNYRPSSGTRRPPSTSGVATAASSAAGAAAGQVRHPYNEDYDEGDDSHDDDDVGARLQQQVEANMLRTTGPGPAPPPRRTILPASSPGSYLPPRVGAAPSMSLGAPSPAAAAAAAVAAGSRMGKAVAAVAAASGVAQGGAQGQVPAGEDNYPEESEFEIQLQRHIDSDFAAGGGVGVTGGLAGARSPAPRSGGGGGAGWRGTTGAAAVAGGRSSTAGGFKVSSGSLHRSNSAASNASLSAGGGGGGGGGGVTGMARRLSADSAAAAAAGDKAAIVAAGARDGSGGSSAPRQRSGTAAATGSGGTATRVAAPRGGSSAAASGSGTGGSTARSAKGAAAGGGSGGSSGTSGGGGGAPPKAGNGAAAAAPSKANGIVSVQRLKANWDALG